MSVATLPPSDFAELERHEATIERGLTTFIEVGGALLSIRDGRLYRDGYGTFEDYCRERWGFTRSRAYRLMEAAEVVERVLPIGDTAPANEAQARPLAALSPEEQPVAWQRAVDTLPPGERMTAAHVERAVRSMTPGEANGYTDDGFYDEPAAELVTDELPFTDDDRDSGRWRPPTPAPAPFVAPPAALVSSVSNEWYTPAAYVDAAREVMDGIDLDPASTEYANRIVGAAVYHTADDDGLSLEWCGRVWLNPPYGRGDEGSNQGRWADYLLTEHRAGRVHQAVLLVNGSALSTRWFAPLWAFPICITDHRIHFYNEAGVASQPAHGSALIYLGPKVDEFDRVFSRFGVVAVRRTDWSKDA